MDRKICRKCGCDHCVIVFRKHRKSALVKVDDHHPIFFKPSEVVGATHIVEQYNGAFRYQYNDGGDILPAVDWVFDDCVPAGECKCYTEQLVSSLNSDEDSK